MYNKEFPAIAETEAELAALSSRERDARLRARLDLLWLIRSGRVATRREAAEVLAVHRNSLRNWLLAYERGGLAGMLVKRKGGPAPEQKTLSPEVYRDLGMRLDAGEFSHYVAIRDWLRAEHELEVPYRTVHGLVRERMGVNLKPNRAPGGATDECEPVPSTPRRTDYPPRTPGGRSYRLLCVGERRRPAIQCLVCGMTSYSRADIDNRYCGACDVFHHEEEERGTPSS